MKRVLFILFLGLIAIKCMHMPTPIDRSIGRLPVLNDGRIKPLDTLARQSLLELQGRLRLPTKQTPTHWLFQTMTQSTGQDTPLILVEHPQLFEAVDDQFHKQKFRVSESFLTTYLPNIQPLVVAAESLEKQERSPIQQAAYILFQRYSLLKSLRHGFFPTINDSSLVFWNDMISLSQGLDNTTPQSDPDFQTFLTYYNQLAQYDGLLLVFNTPWESLPNSALDVSQANTNLLQHYLALSDAFRVADTDAIQSASDAILTAFHAWSPTSYWRVYLEYLFNILNPFIVSLFLYLIIVGLVCLKRIILPLPFLHRFESIITSSMIRDTWRLAIVFHLFGLLSRMIILGRPPVINLYSSAVFIGAVVSVLGYRLFIRQSAWFIAGYTATLALLTQIVAYHLSLSGDTMVVMQAVLNSNFWLSTHVVSMTIGYAIILMAGFLAISYITIGTLTPMLSKDLKKQLVTWVYILLMVALFFNFLGTILGGIWADQSWGRFWGWDPKENGALLIVLWIAIILHAKWGRLLTDRWLMVLTVFSNVVTAWSWKGTNMLGIGLHSYGFTEKTFYWLMLFFASQLAIMGLGMIPESIWVSSQHHDD